MKIRFSNSKSDVFLAYIVKKWTELTNKGVGRIQLQKLCYLSKAKGVPLSFEFKFYHYGPFSQQIYDNTDSLILDGILIDKQNDLDRSEYIPGSAMDQYIEKKKEVIEPYKSKLDSVVETLDGLSPNLMELTSTVHYAYRALKDYYEKEPARGEVIDAALKLKQKKFTKETLENAYEVLKDHGLLKWGNGLA